MLEKSPGLNIPKSPNTAAEEEQKVARTSAAAEKKLVAVQNSAEINTPVDDVSEAGMNAWTQPLEDREKGAPLPVKVAEAKIEAPKEPKVAKAAAPKVEKTQVTVEPPQRTRAELEKTWQDTMRQMDDSDNGVKGAKLDVVQYARLAQQHAFTGMLLSRMDKAEKEKAAAAAAAPSTPVTPAVATAPAAPVAPTAAPQTPVAAPKPVEAAKETVKPRMENERELLQEYIESLSKEEVLTLVLGLMEQIKGFKEASGKTPATPAVGPAVATAPAAPVAPTTPAAAPQTPTTIVQPAPKQPVPPVTLGESLTGVETLVQDQAKDYKRPKPRGFLMRLFFGK